MRRIARQLSSSSTMITRTITGRGAAGGLKRTKSSDDALVSILQNKKVIFTVTYDKNSDTAKQEYQTVVECIHAIFPGSDIIENAVDGKRINDDDNNTTPIDNNNNNDVVVADDDLADTITISAEVMLNDYEDEEDDDNDANNETIPYLIWNGTQSLLQRSSKNPIERTNTIKEIKDNLRELINELIAE